MLLEEPLAGETPTMFYTTSSLGQAGRRGVRIALRASRRAIGGRELRADHGAVPVALAGALSSGASGEHVVVARRDLHGFYWTEHVVTTGVGGHFSTRWQIGTSSAFVAYWIGAPGQTGAGSRGLTITVPSR
jgi:hypothetical protein